MKTNPKSEQTKQAGLSQRTSESGRAGNGASPAQAGKVKEARKAAAVIGGRREFQKRNAAVILSALEIFGGRVLAVVTE